MHLSLSYNFQEPVSRVNTRCGKILAHNEKGKTWCGTIKKATCPACINHYQLQLANQLAITEKRRLTVSDLAINVRFWIFHLKATFSNRWSISINWVHALNWRVFQVYEWKPARLSTLAPSTFDLAIAPTLLGGTAIWGTYKGFQDIVKGPGQPTAYHVGIIFAASIAFFLYKHHVEAKTEKFKKDFGVRNE
jgi:hypothetical protein